MFESIKEFAASLDGKSLAIGAVLGGVVLGTAAVIYSAFSGDDEVPPTPVNTTEEPTDAGSNEPTDGDTDTEADKPAEQ